MTSFNYFYQILGFCKFSHFKIVKLALHRYKLQNERKTQRKKQQYKNVIFNIKRGTQRAYLACSVWYLLCFIKNLNKTLRMLSGGGVVESTGKLEFWGDYDEGGGRAWRYKGECVFIDQDPSTSSTYPGILAIISTPCRADKNLQNMSRTFFSIFAGLSLNLYK